MKPPQAEAHEIKAKNINPYLVDAPDVIIGKSNTAYLRCSGNRYRQQAN